MRSSQLNNQARGEFAGIKHRSFYSAGAGLIISSIHMVIFNELIPWIPILGTVIPFLISEWGYKGEFPNQNIELFKIKLIRLCGRYKTNDVDDLVGTVFTPDKEIIYGTDGEETKGFRIICPPSESPLAFTQELYRSLIDKLPDDTLLKDCVVTKPFSSPFIKKYRPKLIEKGISTTERYLFISYQKDVSERERVRLENKLGKHCKPMSSKEIARYMEWVASPLSRSSGEKTPRYTTSQRSDGRYIKCYPGDYVHAAISLCKLPARDVEDSYSNVFNCLNMDDVTSIISTSYKLGLRRTCNLSSQLNCKSYI